MSSALNPAKALIFRIIHRDNLPWILDNGLYARNSGRFDPNHRNIGNVELIDKRSRRVVEVAPGGTLSDYVPFYFTPFSIMMYNITTGYGGITRVPNDQILILVSSLNDVARLNIPFLFTDRHAYTAMARYFSDLNQLDQVDWALLGSRNFKHDPDDPGKKERYQAEALIWHHLPREALLGVCSYTAEIQQWVQAEIDRRGLRLKAIMERSWYF
ncbi:hypothetical protein HDF16_002130 [Granulicella aggregans]|uniref:DarT domain-containing protein n=1 Tax=Granulicella aggregans TaxID=474949 RepID=A0A7W8E3N6_9BACT|nr:DUF4433 domain-containing protein [Granulicella aggregans]MBB5057424.1 hypothetical protein [Granulicella aggregans]